MLISENQCESVLYFGARYLDPKTSRWMSCDPIYDGVKEGFGLYTYCRNNPLIYHDPSGLETEDKKGSFGYVVKSDSVEGAGHAAGWIQDIDNNVYKFFQIIPEKDAKEGKILSKHGKGVLQEIPFESKEKMIEYLKEKGFDRIAEFNDVSKTDLDKMLDKVKNADQWFGDYNLITNNCADFVNKVAEAGNIKGMAGWYPNTNFDQIYKMKSHGQYNITINDKAKDWRYYFDPLIHSSPFFIGMRADVEDMIQLVEGR